MRGFLVAGLILAMIAFIFMNYEEIRFTVCVVHARLTDPLGVKTDGICLLEALVRQQ